MKAKCKGGASWEHEAILNGLKKAKLLRKAENGGTSPLYYKRKQSESPNLGMVYQIHKKNHI